LDLIDSLFKISLFIALVIPILLLLIDLIPVDKSPILFIFISSLLPELELVLVLLVLLVPDLILLFLVFNSILELLLILLVFLVLDSVLLLLLVLVIELD